ncbi:MAG: DUF2135 domain-containing protein [Bdellovibrionota bacterium]
MKTFSILIMIAITGATALPVAAQVKIDNPIRGWRTGSGATDVVQDVHYPASSVNTAGNTDPSQQIRGAIKSASKTGAPLTLIVNGLDMPQRSDGDTFARTYAFGKGSNSVEVRSGKERHAVQFYETNTSLTPTRLRVLLSWDSNSTDLDLHLVTPEGEHCYYGNRKLASGAALDVDVTTGYGPEIISVPSPRNGTYLVYVNYYGSGETGDALTTAKVSIVSQAGTPDEKIESSLVPLRAPGELTMVKSFKYP